MQFKLTTIFSVLALTAVTSGMIRPATIIPFPLPKESHSITPLFTGVQTDSGVEPRLVHIPPAHPSPEPLELESIGNKPTRVHARSFIPEQKVLKAKRTASAQPEQQTQSEVAVDIAALKQQLQARAFVAQMVHKMREAAVHKREVERIHKVARRAKTEEALKEVLQMVTGAVQRRAEMVQEQIELERRERIVEGIKEVLHLE